ncbi:MAG: hypothetical protein AB8H47_26255 [Bacteroidia bacterium]
MKNLRHSVLFILVSLLLINVQAQNAEAEKQLEAEVREFATTYANLPTTKDKAAVLKYFSKEVTSVIYVFNISGKSRASTGDYKGFESYLDNMLRASGIELGYDIVEISNIFVSGDNATVSYRVNYETKIPNGIWVKGSETVTLAFEKRGDIWMIVHYTIVQFEDEKLKGTCLCELFISEADDGEVVSKTTIPSGRSYNTEFNNFEFRTVGGDQIIKVKDKVYKRLKTGAVIAMRDGEEVQIGISNSKKETVLMIIGDDLYGDSCATLKTKK